MNEPTIIGDATLYLGDCLDILPTLDPVDAVVTDPPYMVTPTSITHYTNPGMIKGGWMSKEYPVGNGEMFGVEDFDNWMSVVLAACATDADAYFMTNDKQMMKMRASAEKAGWKFHNLLVWQKPHGIPNRWYFKDCEFTLYMWKGKAKTIRPPASTQVFRAPSTHPDRRHVSQKPVSLMQHYAGNSTDDGDAVLDPFMGSGTTGIACAKLGRKFIGIEIEPKYFDIACERIQKAYDQPDFFVEPPKPAVQQQFVRMTDRLNP